MQPSLRELHEKLRFVAALPHNDDWEAMPSNDRDAVAEETVCISSMQRTTEIEQATYMAARRPEEDLPVSNKVASAASPLSDNAAFDSSSDASASSDSLSGSPSVDSDEEPVKRSPNEAATGDDINDTFPLSAGEGAIAFLPSSSTSVSSEPRDQIDHGEDEPAVIHSDRQALPQQQSNEDHGGTEAMPQKRDDPLAPTTSNQSNPVRQQSDQPCAPCDSRHLVHDLEVNLEEAGNDAAIANLLPELSIADRLEALHSCNSSAAATSGPLSLISDPSQSADRDTPASGGPLRKSTAVSEGRRLQSPVPWPPFPVRGGNADSQSAAESAQGNSEMAKESPSVISPRLSDSLSAQQPPQAPPWLPVTQRPISDHNERSAAAVGNSSEAAQQQLPTKVVPSGSSPGSLLVGVEDDGMSEHSLSWRRHHSHLFVITAAGKPVFTRHGEESALAGLTALTQALFSFAIDRGDSIRSIRSGRHQVVAVQKGRLLMVAVSSGNEPTVVLRRRLDLLHGQITLLVTDAIDRLFAKNPRYDGRNLLTGTTPLLRALADEMDRSPWALLPAFPPAPMPSHMTAAAALALQSAVAGSGAEHGVVLCNAGVVAVASTRGGPLLHPSDLLLLTILVRHSESLRQSESMCPVCLPKHDPSVFLHAYIAFLRPAAGYAVVLLAAAPDAFPRLGAAREVLETALNAAGVTQAVLAGAKTPTGGRMRLCTDLGTGLDPMGCHDGSDAAMIPAGALRHFVYFVPSRRQYLAPTLEPWPGCPSTTARDLMSSVARAHVALFGEAGVDDCTTVVPAVTSSPGGPAALLSVGGRASVAAPSMLSPVQRLHFVADARETMLAYASQEAVLYAVLQPGIGKAAALEACQTLTALLKARQPHLFLPG